MADKTIVAGVDGSETAAIAAERAAVLAQALDARLHLISAFGKFESETVRIGSDTLMLSNETEAEKVAAKAATLLRSAYPDVTITTAAAEGKPGEALVSVAEALGADLIVVGNKRVQGIAGRVLGSIARDVAAHASCDVYVAHTHDRG
ncbi:universal stress protein [Pimelobacter simplex]|uniref:Universal stress protein n=1 Tax=Nocardioides simplex TaxID=2045 RepID=A0A0A1DT26_NOCSI|nr:universal stress protein [Pimelobacter simplex]AIY19797.2 Universal stress protein UspA-related nucleotide-binding proteins [Pimelobacter simplex]KAB2809215.1 universal stress protein [Pimelobacter simplex]MCG8151857.1 universal stress protein [Pimelobacter simplex]SFM56900.1 Nucleotide-binding universal stress protein, UspA family [Pimelobacter simplex]GEB12615.1 universal stress protein A [Pimelobacter simplex]